MKIATFALVGVAAALAGCSTPRHQCELQNGGSGKCASMMDAYAASQAKLGSKMPKGQESVFGHVQKDSDDEKPSASLETTKVAQPVFTGQATDYPTPGQQGTPVFKQPRVHRVWVAPYVDADGNLRSGEYAYFSTPGEWNYGTMKKKGSASSATTFGPTKGDNYGVNIQNTNRNIVSGSNAAPPLPTPNQNPQVNRGAIQLQNNAQQSDADAVPVDGITQPIQRFN